jgi:hypothetical protein
MLLKVDNIAVEEIFHLYEVQTMIKITFKENDKTKLASKSTLDFIDTYNTYPMEQNAAMECTKKFNAILDSAKRDHLSDPSGYVRFSAKIMKNDILNGRYEKDSDIADDSYRSAYLEKLESWIHFDEDIIAD